MDTQFIVPFILDTDNLNYKDEHNEGILFSLSPNIKYDKAEFRLYRDEIEFYIFDNNEPIEQPVKQPELEDEFKKYIEFVKKIKHTIGDKVRANIEIMPYPLEKYYDTDMSSYFKCSGIQSLTMLYFITTTDFTYYKSNNINYDLLCATGEININIPSKNYIEQSHTKSYFTQKNWKKIESGDILRDIKGTPDKLKLLLNNLNETPEWSKNIKNWKKACFMFKSKEKLKDLKTIIVNDAYKYKKKLGHKCWRFEKKINGKNRTLDLIKVDNVNDILEHIYDKDPNVTWPPNTNTKKKKRHLWLIPVPIVLVLAVLTSLLIFNNINKEINNIIFKDPILESVIREKLQKRNKPLNINNLKIINCLDLYSKGIEDLDGIQHLSNIQYLNLSNNSIEDISLLSDMKYLMYLNLSNNNIKNIKPIIDMYNKGSFQYSEPINISLETKEKPLVIKNNYINIENNKLNLEMGSINYIVIKTLLNKGSDKEKWIEIIYSEGNKPDTSIIVPDSSLSCTIRMSAERIFTKKQVSGCITTLNKLEQIDLSNYKEYSNYIQNLKQIPFYNLTRSVIPL
ncbi:MAG: hypothetical protein ACOCV8_05035, partial [Spirochaetota bacterium]